MNAQERQQIKAFSTRYDALCSSLPLLHTWRGIDLSDGTMCWDKSKIASALTHIRRDINYLRAHPTSANKQEILEGLEHLLTNAEEATKQLIQEATQ